VKAATLATDRHTKDDRLNGDAAAIGSLVKAWESCQERIRIHRNKPMPGVLRPERKARNLLSRRNSYCRLRCTKPKCPNASALWIPMFRRPARSTQLGLNRWMRENRLPLGVVVWEGWRVVPAIPTRIENPKVTTAACKQEARNRTFSSLGLAWSTTLERKFRKNQTLL